MISPQVMSVAEELEVFQQTRDDAWNVPRAEGMLLHTLVLLGGCRKLVEVGTSYGFSGLFLASAARANGGILHTYDIEARKHQVAGEYFAKAGLSQFIMLHTGDARKELASLDGGIDFLFLDASKPQTLDYWHAVEGRLARRCAVTVDNTRTHRHELADFIHMLRTRDDFVSCDLPVGNGLELAVRAG